MIHRQRYRDLVFCLVVSVPSVVLASAWPREQGSSFLSVSIQSTVGGFDYGDYGSFYYEYGMTENVTLGIDAGKNLLADDSSGLFFIQVPLNILSEQNLLALQFGLGGADVSGRWRSALRPGLSWGRPYEASWAKGWLGVDASYARYSGGESLVKVDATFGINHDNGSITMTQLQGSSPSSGEATLALAPSRVLPFGANSFIELGGVYQFNNHITSLKIGIWSDY